MLIDLATWNTSARATRSPLYETEVATIRMG